MRKPHKRFKPAGAVTILDKDRLATIFLYSYNGQPAAVGYIGKRARPDIHIRCDSQTVLESKMRGWLDGVRRLFAEKLKHRASFNADPMSRNNVIMRIKKGLADRGFKASVTGGRGTAWGWITIGLPAALEARMDSEAKRTAWGMLYDALGITQNVFRTSGVSVPASSAYYQEYIDRAEGRTPTVRGTPYWD